jgi:hypothetical protein
MEPSDHFGLLRIKLSDLYQVGSASLIDIFKQLPSHTKSEIFRNGWSVLLFYSKEKRERERKKRSIINSENG